MSPPFVDVAAAERAVRDLLVALRTPVDADPELRDTPARVARALADELLDGYRIEPSALFDDAIASVDAGLVVVTGVRYASMCPHHLMPSLGRADVGYLARGRVAGLGAL